MWNSCNCTIKYIVKYFQFQKGCLITTIQKNIWWKSVMNFYKDKVPVTEWGQAGRLILLSTVNKLATGDLASLLCYCGQRMGHITYQITISVLNVGVCAIRSAWQITNTTTQCVSRGNASAPLFLFPLPAHRSSGTYCTQHQAVCVLPQHEVIGKTFTAEPETWQNFVPL